MKRAIVAIGWLIGATVPLLLATVFLVGCCVLPFHQFAHKLMPVCHIAADLLRGGAGEHHDEQQSAPAREKDEPAKRLVTTKATFFRFRVVPSTDRFALDPVPMYRSFITLGAVRCDQDVGLHLLVATFLI